MKFKHRDKIVKKWREKNGAATFDFKTKNILLHDGGLFAIEKEIKKHYRSRFVPITESPFKGGSKMVEIKSLPKQKIEHYTAYLWFEELHETINYLKRMEKLLKQLGYETNREYSGKTKN